MAFPEYDEEETALISKQFPGIDWRVALFPCLSRGGTIVSVVGRKGEVQFEGGGHMAEGAAHGVLVYACASAIAKRLREIERH